jgi:transcriptional regulator with XRE-family HTH domain
LSRNGGSVCPEHTFGKRLRECREAKGLSQQELGKQMNTSYTVIGKYERDEMKPSIEVAAKLAKLIDTTVGYLLGEVDETDTFKDPVMLQRLKEINSLSDEEKKCVLFNLDAVLRDTKTRRAYAK